MYLRLLGYPLEHLTHLWWKILCLQRHTFNLYNCCFVTTNQIHCSLHPTPPKGLQGPKLQQRVNIIPLQPCRQRLIDSAAFQI
ncbi:hypothetical protein D3C76_1695840 [compost metagenome]